MRRWRNSAAAGATAIAMTAAAVGIAAAQDRQEAVTYKAELAPLNANVTGSNASGEAVFTISGDRLTIHISVKGVPPGIEHLQHFHGFATGNKDAECPTADGDANRDGVIDLIETEPAAGATMVPFHDDPVSMEIVKDTYPKAGADGSYSYDKTVSLKALQQAFAAKFPGQHLDLDRRVVFIHGVPDTAKLPKTAASLGDIPARITLPIACGAIKKAGG
jgi:hypothetical protein